MSRRYTRKKNNRRNGGSKYNIEQNPSGSMGASTFRKKSWWKRTKNKIKGVFTKQKVSKSAPSSLSTNNKKQKSIWQKFKNKTKKIFSRKENKPLNNQTPSSTIPVNPRRLLKFNNNNINPVTVTESADNIELRLLKKELSSIENKIKEEQKRLQSLKEYPSILNNLIRNPDSGRVRRRTLANSGIYKQHNKLRELLPQRNKILKSISNVESKIKQQNNLKEL